jgi:hypothetical protein
MGCISFFPDPAKGESSLVSPYVPADTRENKYVPIRRDGARVIIESPSKIMGVVTHVVFVIDEWIAEVPLLFNNLRSVARYTRCMYIMDSKVVDTYLRVIKTIE